MDVKLVTLSWMDRSQAHVSFFNYSWERAHGTIYVTEREKGRAKNGEKKMAPQTQFTSQQWKATTISNRLTQWENYVMRCQDQRLAGWKPIGNENHSIIEFVHCVCMPWQC